MIRQVKVVYRKRLFTEGQRCNVEVMGFVFGLMGFIFAVSALGKIRKLEMQLKESGALKQGANQAE